MAHTSTSSSAGTKPWDILEEVGAGTHVEHSGIPEGRGITLLQHCSSCLSVCLSVCLSEGWKEKVDSCGTLTHDSQLYMLTLYRLS